MKNNMVNLITASATENRFPDNTPYSAISVKDINRIADKLNSPVRDIELAALNMAIMPERYSRNRNSLSLEDQITLLNKSVCIVGLGGLGGTVTDILARMGVGKLLLIDGDFFEDSNLNRQLLSTVDTLGESKALRAAKRVRQINPAVEAVCQPDFLTEANADRLTGYQDVFVDCLDNLKTRFILEGISKKAGVPMVSGAVAGSTGQVTTIFPNDSGLCRVYGDPEKLPEKGVEAALGTLPYSVSIVAALECAEVSKVLLNKGSPLRNKLLIINPFENFFEVMNLS